MGSIFETEMLSQERTEVEVQLHGAMEACRKLGFIMFERREVLENLLKDRPMKVVHEMFDRSTQIFEAAWETMRWREELREAQYDVRKATRRVGVSRNSFYDRMETNGLDPERMRDPSVSDEEILKENRKIADVIDSVIDRIYEIRNAMQSCPELWDAIENDMCEWLEERHHAMIGGNEKIAPTA